jgi:DNA adenine methylase
VNKSGEFNVPYGNRAFSYDRQIFLEIHSLIKKVTFTCGDYRWQTRDAEPGDFVYLDPPYDDCFNGYSKEKFSQRELANYCRVLHKRGVKFIVSNKDTPRIRNLFRAFNIENIGVFHSISASSKGRSVVGEVLIKNY